MKTGLILLIVGHLSFITAALVHGTVLRFVLTARDATSLHYGVTNSASVIAALLVPRWGHGGDLGRVGMREGCRMDAALPPLPRSKQTFPAQTQGIQHSGVSYCLR